MSPSYPEQLELEKAISSAEQKRSHGNISGAYIVYQAIVDKRLGKEHNATDLTVFHSFAELAAMHGDFELAHYALERVKEDCQAEGNLHWVDFAILQQIHLVLDQGKNVRQAQSFFEELSPRIGQLQSIEITTNGLVEWETKCCWPKADFNDRTILFAFLYLEGGRLLSILGQYNDARTMLSRGLVHAKPRDSQMRPILARRLVPWFQLAISRAYLESGKLSDAEAVLDDLKGFLGGEQERFLQIHWYMLAGKIALLRGFFGIALKNFEKILAICHQLKITTIIITASFNLAKVLIVLNQNQLAEEYLIAIKADVEKEKDSHLSARLTLLSKLTQARSQSLVAGSTLSVTDLLSTSAEEGSSADKRVSHEEFDLICSQASNYLTFFEDRVLEFQWYLSQSDLSKASHMLTRIQATFEYTDSELIHTKIKTLHGILAYYQGVNELQKGDPYKGQRYIHQAAVILDHVRPLLYRMELRPERWQVQRLLGWCLMRSQASSRDQEVLVAETNQLLEEITESLDPEQQAIFLLNKWTADEEYLASQISKLKRLKQQLQKAPFHQRHKLWWQILKRLNTLANHTDHYRGILAKRTTQAIKITDHSGRNSTSLWDRLLKQPWKRATISFLVLPDQIFVIRNWRFWLDFSIIPLTRLELRNSVQQWFTTLEKMRSFRGISLKPEADRPDRNNVFNTQKTAALVQKLSLSSLLNLPKYISHLTIVPDDVLHIFPFAAVKYQEKYLIESYSLSIAYETKPSRNKATQSQSLLPPYLVGVSQHSKQFPALPGVKRELASIQSWLIQQRVAPKVLLDKHVNKEQLLSVLESIPFLHIACHGIFQNHQAEKSGLVLVPHTEPPEILSLREIANLNLSNLRHVTLSACSSADHLVLPGRWVVSLPETLWRAGVHSILGSLWEVYDEFAISFMTRFYGYLKTMPRDQALKHTQLDCLYLRLPIHQKIDTSNPKYWSGFNLYGEFRPLKT